jgi:hypothetical protein
MKVIRKYALSFTKMTLMNTVLFTTVMSLVGNRLVELTYSSTLVVLALMFAKVLITTVVTIKIRVA